MNNVKEVNFDSLTEELWMDMWKKENKPGHETSWFKTTIPRAETIDTKAALAQKLKDQRNRRQRRR